MRQTTGWVCVLVAGLTLVFPAAVRAQDTPAAKLTRERLKKITIEEVDWKDTMTREILAEIARESDKKIKFKVDNVSGMSNNTRMTYKAKNVSVEKILNDLADKNDFGWFVFSNPKDPNSQMNGTIILRKSKYKERGYEEGKEPKKSAAPGGTERLLAGTAVEGLRMEALRVSGFFIREKLTIDN